jgi:hypothetical protein
MRTIEELTATADPAWPQLETELLANSEITVLPIAPAAGREGHSKPGAVALKISKAVTVRNTSGKSFMIRW